MRSKYWKKKRYENVREEVRKKKGGKSYETEGRDQLRRYTDVKSGREGGRESSKGSMISREELC